MKGGGRSERDEVLLCYRGSPVLSKICYVL